MVVWGCDPRSPKTTGSFLYLTVLKYKGRPWRMPSNSACLFCSADAAISGAVAGLLPPNCESPIHAAAPRTSIRTPATPSWTILVLIPCIYRKSYTMSKGGCLGKRADGQTGRGAGGQAGMRPGCFVGGGGFRANGVQPTPQHDKTPCPWVPVPQSWLGTSCAGKTVRARERGYGGCSAFVIARDRSNPVVGEVCP